MRIPFQRWSIVYLGRKPYAGNFKAKLRTKPKWLLSSLRCPNLTLVPQGDTLEHSENRNAVVANIASSGSTDKCYTVQDTVECGSACWLLPRHERVPGHIWKFKDILPYSCIVALYILGVGAVLVALFLPF